MQNLHLLATTCQQLRLQSGQFLNSCDVHLPVICAQIVLNKIYTYILDHVQSSFDVEIDKGFPEVGCNVSKVKLLMIGAGIVYLVDETDFL